MDKHSSFGAVEWPNFMAGQEERWRLMSAANARLMRGMLAVWRHEIELGQQLMAENMADPKVITEAFTGGIDLGAQLSTVQRRFARTLTAARKINDEFYDCLFEVAAMASGEAEANGETKPPAAQAARTAARSN